MILEEILSVLEIDTTYKSIRIYNEVEKLEIESVNYKKVNKYLMYNVIEISLDNWASINIKIEKGS